MIFFEHVFHFYKKFWMTVLFCVVIYHIFYLIWHHFFYLATFSLSIKQKKKKNLLYLHIFSIPIIFYRLTFSPLTFQPKIPNRPKTIPCVQFLNPIYCTGHWKRIEYIP